MSWGYWQRWRRSRSLALANQEFAYLWDVPPLDEYISLDCEMSCLDPRQAEILSIAAIRIKGSRIFLSEHLKLLVKPAGQIDPASIAVHGLRHQDVQEGMAIEDALAALLNFIGPRPLIGYYLEFDLAVLGRLLKPMLGVALPNASIEVSGLFYDHMVTAHRPDVDLSLSHILQTLNLPDLPRHDPLNDALLAAMIYLKLGQK
ncbi:3'-5' exonuclease [Janthinobacterium sp. B9-8]|uniref:3'-5' exonuclease n=1 Tax=Janthinobacterium sp. B9-8 TaxID=1236179 RepID=UPI00061CE11C|nr:3'-5' exonuclease [Janthinobacterium sp. B9-8]AMC35539.1 DNA polymerase III subunit epsilon [Janthinobacterium sp. B9-8]